MNIRILAAGMSRMLLVCLVAVMLSVMWVSAANADIPYVVDWTRQAGTSGQDYSYGVTTDSSGNVYVCGGTAGGLDGNTSAGSYDLFIAKYDSAGVKQWTRQMGTYGIEYAFGVVTDSAGNVYTCGYTNGGLDGNVFAGINDLFVVKYDPAGVKQWSRQLGTAVEDLAYSIAIDSSANVYVCGHTRGGLDGNLNQGGRDLFVVKYSSTGVKQWTRQLGSGSDEYAYGIATDTAGNVYVGGYTGGSLDGNTSCGSNDIYMVKYNSAGVKQWTRQAGTAGSEYGYSITTDPSNNVYVCGATAGSLDGNANAGSYDLCVVKYDSTGVKQWTRQLGTSNEEYAWGVSADPAGYVYVCGRTGAGLDGNTSAGDVDIFVVKFASSGVKQWTQQIGTATYEIGRGVTTTSFGKVYICGSTMGGLNGNTNAGGNDYYVQNLVPVESVPPVSTITAPTAGATLAGDGCTITGTSDDGTGSGVAFVDVSTDGGASWHRASGTTSWSYNWTLPVNGVYNVRSRAADAVGNIETAGTGRNVTVANPPSSTLLAPLNGAVIPLALGNYSITGTAAARGVSGLRKVEVSIDSGAWTTVDDISGAGTWTAWSWQWNPLISGTHTIAARASDNGGLVETGGPAITVTVDGDDPSSTVTAPADGAHVEACLGTYVVTGTASDPTSGVSLVEVSTDGGATWLPASGTASWSYVWTLPISGSYNIRSKATDLAGHVETAGAGVTVLVDNTPSEFLWTRQLGTAAADHGMDLATDSSGNAYVAGYTGGALDGNPNTGGADLFVSKYDAGGTKQWTKQLGSASYDYAMGIALDRDRNIYVTGYTGGGLDGNANQGGTDMFLVKFDKSGTKLWTRQLGGTGNERGRSVALADDGGIYVAGYTDGGLDGNTGSGSQDVFLVKYDAAGNRLWTVQTGTSSYDYAMGLSAGKDGCVYVTGYTGGGLHGNANAGEADAFVMKYGPGGVRLWTRQLGTSAWDGAYGVSVDAEGNAYAAGGTYDGIGGNTNAGEFDPFTGGYTSDMFVVKYGPDGVRLWTRQLGTAGNDTAYDVSVDSNGSATVAGRTEGGIGGGGNAGAYDLFVSRYNASGLPLWTRQAGTSGIDQAYGVSADMNGSVYLAGSTYGGLNGNASSGVYDMFVAKLGGSIESYITDPVDRAAINTSSYTVSGRADDYSVAGVKTVEVSTDNGSTWSTASDTSGNGSWATWNYNWTPVPLGSHTLKSRATDLNDKVETPGAGVMVTADFQKPASMVVYPTANLSVGGTVCIITGTASDGAGSGVALVEVSTDNGATWHPATGTTNWSYAWTLPTDWEYFIKTRATDFAGNVEDVVSYVMVDVDNTPPGVSLYISYIDYGPGAQFTNSTTVTLLFEVYDVKPYIFFGMPPPGTPYVIGDCDMQFSNNGTGWTAWEPASETKTWTLSGGDGLKTVYVKFRDRAGNVSNAISKTITLDATPPTVGITSPASNAVVTSTSVTVAGSASDTLSGVTGVEVSTDGGGTWSASGGGASWSASWSIDSAGPHTFMARATDGAGNVTNPPYSRTVTAKSTLSASRTGINLGCNKARPAAITKVRVTASPWDVTVSPAGTKAWLSGTPGSAATGSDFVVSANPAALAAGNYTGTAAFSSAYAVSPAGVPVSITVSSSALSPELQHDNWNPVISGGGCGTCHATISRFLGAGYKDEPSLCRSCHNASSVAHDKPLLAGPGHILFVNATAAGRKKPTYGNMTAAKKDNQPFAHLMDGHQVVCVTCHNPMGKYEDYARTWEYTTTTDRLTYFLVSGGWSNYGSLAPMVYRSATLIAAPAYSKNRKGYIVSPSEYTYDETAGTVTFNTAQSASSYIYVSLDYPYLRARNMQNSLCADCHTEVTHKGSDCLTCHTAHNTDNAAGIRGVVRTTDRTEKTVVFDGTTGLKSFADGDGTFDGICEVCHTTTKYHRRDGSGFVNHSSGLNQAGRDCTACHTHTGGFAR